MTATLEQLEAGKLPAGAGIDGRPGVGRAAHLHEIRRTGRPMYEIRPRPAG